MKNIDWFPIFWIGIIMFVFVSFTIGMSVPSKYDKEYVKDKQFNRCLEYMQVAIPDPNDTEARSQFIKTNCQF